MLAATWMDTYADALLSLRKKRGLDYLLPASAWVTNSSDPMVAIRHKSLCGLGTEPVTNPARRLLKQMVASWKDTTPNQAPGRS